MPGRARAAGLLMMVPALYAIFELFSVMDRTGANFSLTTAANGWARETFGFWQSGLDGQERAFYALSGAVLLLALILGVLTMLRGALVVSLLFLVIEALLAVPGMVWNINDQTGWRKLPSWLFHVRAIPFHYGPASAWLWFAAAVLGLILGIGARRTTGRQRQEAGYQPYPAPPGYLDPTALQPPATEQPPAYPAHPTYPAQPTYPPEQATPAPAIAAAGWYPDPYGQTAQRYWDGSGWTEHTQA
jgi:hypothetical protein